VIKDEYSFITSTLNCSFLQRVSIGLLHTNHPPHPGCICLVNNKNVKEILATFLRNVIDEETDVRTSTSTSSFASSSSKTIETHVRRVCHMSCSSHRLCYEIGLERHLNINSKTGQTSYLLRKFNTWNAWIGTLLKLPISRQPNLWKFSRTWHYSLTIFRKTKPMLWEIIQSYKRYARLTWAKLHLIIIILSCVCVTIAGVLGSDNGFIYHFKAQH
jgi:hypothetical protein